MQISLIKRIEQLAGPAVAAQLRAEYGGAAHCLPNPRPERTTPAFEASDQALSDELARPAVVRTAAAAWGGAGMSAVQAAQRCVVVQPAGHAITGHPRAFSVLPRRDDWPWQDDFAALDAPNLLPQGSHDAFDSPTLDCLYIGFTVHRAGGLS